MIESIPAEVLPDPFSDSEFYADVHVQYPLSEQLISLHMGHKMYLEAQLYYILSETASSGPAAKLSLADAFRLKGKLDHWYARINKSFNPRILVFPIHFDIQ